MYRTTNKQCSSSDDIAVCLHTILHTTVETSWLPGLDSYPTHSHLSYVSTLSFFRLAHTLVFDLNHICWYNFVSKLMRLIHVIAKLITYTAPSVASIVHEWVSEHPLKPMTHSRYSRKRILINLFPTHTTEKQHSSLDNKCLNYRIICSWFLMFIRFELSL